MQLVATTQRAGHAAGIDLGIDLRSLPTSFLEGIVNHHGDLESPSMFARSVQLADELAHAVDDQLQQVEGEPLARRPLDRPLLVATAESLGIDPQVVEGLAEQVAERYELIAAMLTA